MALNKEQVDQLLKPINKARILLDGKSHKHVSQQDVLAHLIRVFGFGNFDIEVLDVAMVFETERTDAKTGVLSGKWDVCYRALVRLTIRDEAGNKICHLENGSMDTAENQKRGEAHDLAYKSAISVSVKRAAIALGDQFGLSLYNKGQESALVMSTLIHPDVSAAAKGGDVQEGVTQQVTLGNDEVDREEDSSPEATKTEEPNASALPVPSEDQLAEIKVFLTEIAESIDEVALKALYAKIPPNLLDVPVNKTTIKIATTKRIKELRAGA